MFLCSRLAINVREPRRRDREWMSRWMRALNSIPLYLVSQHWRKTALFVTLHGQRISPTRETQKIASNPDLGKWASYDQIYKSGKIMDLSGFVKIVKIQFTFWATTCFCNVLFCFTVSKVKCHRSFASIFSHQLVTTRNGSNATATCHSEKQWNNPNVPKVLWCTNGTITLKSHPGVKAL